MIDSTTECEAPESGGEVGEFRLGFAALTDLFVKGKSCRRSQRISHQSEGIARVPERRRHRIRAKPTGFTYA